MEFPKLTPYQSEGNTRKVNHNCSLKRFFVLTIIECLTHILVQKDYFTASYWEYNPLSLNFKSELFDCFCRYYPSYGTPSTKSAFLSSLRDDNGNYIKIPIPSSHRPLGVPNTPQLALSPFTVRGRPRARSMRNFTSLSRPLLIG